MYVHNVHVFSVALSETGAVLDSLPALKRRIEGTFLRYKPVTLDSTHLSQLKHLVVSHTPANLHEQTKSLITENLSSVFKGQVKQLLFACVLTCPWFARAQAEVSGKGKNNQLYVVFVGSNEHFFSLTSHHGKGLNETIDEVYTITYNYLYCRAIFFVTIFILRVVSLRVRFVDSVNCSEMATYGVLRHSVVRRSL